MFKKTTLICSALIALSTSAHADNRTGKILKSKMPVDAEFLEWGLHWQSGIRYEALVALKAIDGRIAFCGVGYLNNHSLRQINSQALKDYKLLINKRVVLANLSYFASARSAKALEKAQSKCKFTSLKENEIGPKPIIELESNKSTYRD